MTAETRYFYDELAPFYHLLYEDWDGAVLAQGEVLGGLLAQYGKKTGRVLDAACGVGTQTLGLAVNGYQVYASDLSSIALIRLSAEAKSRGLNIKTGVDDLRTLAFAQSKSMDVVIACDNSLPHLLNDEDLLAAFHSALRVLKPAGMAVYSIRDYATIKRVNPDVRPYGVRYQGAERFMATQVWEWHGNWYDLRLYLTRETAEGVCTTDVMVTRYYAITIERLMQLMTQAGFENVTRHDGLLFQPIIVGRKTASKACGP